MQVSPNSNSGPVNQNRWPAPPKARGGAGGDTAQFDRAAALNRALADTPDLRANEVERARELIGDAGFPPPETIRRVASLLALHLGDESADA